MSSKDSVLEVGSRLVRPVANVVAKPVFKRDRRDIIALVVVVIAIGIVMQIVSGYVPDYILPSPIAIGQKAP